MLERRNLRQKFRVLLVHSHIGTESAGGRACRTLANEFADRNIETVTAANVDDGRSLIMADTALHAMLIDWSLPTSDGHTGDNSAAIDLINTVRSRNENVPIFLMTEPGKARTLNVEIVQAINELVWISQDSATFVAGRVQAAMKIYLAALLGPLTTALANF
ncbi:MAG: hypothetical protein JO278_12455, partial [Dyella sp.]|nr:hypothetical protein [Dyella sp.]